MPELDRRPDSRRGPCRGTERIFEPADFLESGSRTTVYVILHGIVEQETTRRLSRGVYNLLPLKIPTLVPLLPFAESMAKTLAGRDRTRFQPAPHARNALGLTEQGSALAVFLISSPTQNVRIEPRRAPRSLFLTLSLNERAHSNHRNTFDAVPHWIAGVPVATRRHDGF
ncbi:MAG: DUF6088 family protein [Verrucomicrobiota bacterium]